MLPCGIHIEHPIDIEEKDISSIKQLSYTLPPWNSTEISKSEALQGSPFSLVIFSLPGYILLELF